MHGIDSTQFRRLTSESGSEESNAVHHMTTVLHTITKQVPWGTFRRLCDDHGAIAKAQELSCRDHLTAMMYAQLSGARGLRDIEAGMQSHATRLRQMGVRPVRRSSLADANSYRASEPFTKLFATLVHRAQPALRGDISESLYLIDSTSIRLARSGEWARFSAEVCGAKVHVIYDAGGGCPIYAMLTPARVNDITVAKQMPIEPGATYVDDLGYYDFGWWAQLDQAGCHFVTRLKSNTPLRDIEHKPVQAGSNIVSDCTGSLPKRQAKRRKNPYTKPVREVRVRLDTGALIRVVSNDLDAPAEHIAALYKRRWAIELFFRWIKQNLSIRHLYGRSENALRIQIAVALIVFLLLRLAHGAQRAIPHLQTFVRLVRANLMHRRDINRMLDDDPVSMPRQTAQLQFAWE
jgi:Transposase DDE domain/Domain of unknown function (DUF4372)